MSWSSGVAATVSRTFCAFLNVTMPVKLTSEPIARILRIGAGPSTKQ